MINQDIRICFVGDSFVNGTGDETALGWAGRLCASAQGKGLPVTYYNLGIRRDTSRDVLLRWERECALRLPESCDNRIVFSFGVNDTVIENGMQRVATEESLQNIQQVLKIAQSRYNVIMVGPPVVDDDDHNERIGALTKVFSRVASTLGVPYIAVFPLLISNEHYKQEIKGNDGSHPRSSGYITLGNIIGSSPNWWFSDAR